MNFASLVTRSLQDNNFQYLKQFPQEVLDVNEKRLLSGILEYVDKWGDGETLPTIEYVKSHIDDVDYLLTDYPSTDSLDKIFSETRRKLVERAIKTSIIDAKMKHDDNSLDINEFTKTVERLHQLSRKVTIEPIETADIYKPPTNRTLFKYKSMNEASDGMLGGELCLIVARPKVGKTWVLLDNAIDAVRSGKRVYFSSLEMNRNQIAHRVHAMVGGFNPRYFRNPDKKILKELKDVFEDNKKSWYKNGGIFLTPVQARLTVEQVKADIEKMKPDVVYLDSVYGFIGKNGKPIGDDWGAIMSMVSSLKAMALELDIPFICTTQLKRGAGGGDAELDDIAFGDAFGQFADLVVNLYKHSVDGKTVVGMNFLASRHFDPTVHFYLQFDYEKMSIEEHVSKLFEKYIIVEDFDTDE